jgi:hypothetical protein
VATRQVAGASWPAIAMLFISLYFGYSHDAQNRRDDVVLSILGIPMVLKIEERVDDVIFILSFHKLPTMLKIGERHSECSL